MRIGHRSLLLIYPLIFLSCTMKDINQSSFDLIIKNGLVIDGLGNEPKQMDIGIKGQRIVAIENDIPIKSAKEAIDVSNRVVAPGFIDNHAHIQTTIHEHPLAENFIRQGITSILATLHSGNQPWPLDTYASSLKVAPNVGFYSGHTWTRKQVIGMDNRAPSESELEEMKSYVERSMQQGAIGFTTGLLYVPANFAKTEEVIELAKVASKYGGVYVTHMRNEATGLLKSVNETIRISSEANIPAQINHHKAAGVSQWGWSKKSLALIDSAQAEGVDIVHDLYPYTASSTGSSILFPQWSLAGGSEAFKNRIEDPQIRKKIETEMVDIFTKDRTGGDLTRIQFRVLPSDQSYNGKRLADYAKDRGLENTLANGIQLAIELQLNGGFSAIYHAMDEKDVIRIMQHPLAMIETDGDPISYGVGYPHPRSYGAFPRVLARYVRELKAISLVTAIKKMTSMPADRIGHTDRGRIEVGTFADIVVFDSETIQDNATYTDPHRYATGIDHVIINGSFVLRSGALTGERPGKWLKGPAKRNK